MPERPTKLHLIPVAIAVLLFAVWTWFAFGFSHFTWSDENIHVYVATAVAKGARLYADVPSARPPFGIFVLAALRAIGLAPVWAARTGVVVAMAGITASLLYFGKARHSLLVGALAAIIFFMWPDAYSQVSYSVIHWVALGTLVTVGLMLQGRYLAAGIAAGVALGFGQHALVIASVAVPFTWLRGGKRGAAQYVGAMLATIVAVFGIAYAVGGHAFISDVVLKHLYHVDNQARVEDSGLGFMVGAMLIGASPFALIAIAGAFVRSDAKATSAKSAKPAAQTQQPPLSQRDGTVIAILAATHTLSVLFMKGGLYLYLYPSFALWAWVMALGFERVLAFVSRTPQTKMLIARAAVLGALFVVLLVGSNVALARHYSRRDHTLYASFAPTRMRQMAAVQDMSVAREIAAVIDHTGKAGRTVFGEPQIASIVALEANMSMSGHLADLAPRWIRNGTVDRREIARKIERDHVGFLVTPRWFYFKDRFFRAYLTQCYETPRIFARKRPGIPGSGIPDLLLYTHKPEACPIR